MGNGNLYYSNLFAEEYDSKVTSANWPGPSVIYSLLKDLAKAGDTVIDLGIGTGESSRLLKEAGLFVTGVDGSEGMLKVCAGKNIADKLVLFDLHNSPLPFPPESFDVVVSHALFHLLTQISHLFAEARRVLNNNGIFVFTFDQASDKTGYKKVGEGIWERKTATNVLTYRHEWSYIRQLLTLNGFDLIGKTTYLAYTNAELDEDFYFTAVVARKV